VGPASFPVSDSAAAAIAAAAAAAIGSEPPRDPSGEHAGYGNVGLVVLGSWLAG
jgi:hypothetical protein